VVDQQKLNWNVVLNTVQRIELTSEMVNSSGATQIPNQERGQFEDKAYTPSRKSSTPIAELERKSC
jgi:hypothetical protein